MLESKESKKECTHQFKHLKNKKAKQKKLNTDDRLLSVCLDFNFCLCV